MIGNMSETTRVKIPLYRKKTIKRRDLELFLRVDAKKKVISFVFRKFPLYFAT